MADKTFLQILQENADIDAVIEKVFVEQMRLAIHAEMERIENEILYGDPEPTEKMKREADEWLKKNGLA